MEIQIGEWLILEKEDHEKLGEIFNLRCLADEDGNSPYKIEVEGKGKAKQEIGMNLRLTKDTATKLAWQLLKGVGDTCETF